MADVKRLRELLEKVPRLPWRWEGMGEHGYPQRIMANATLIAETYFGDVDQTPPETELIVAAVNALPALLDVVAHAQVVVAYWKAHEATPEPYIGLLESLGALDPSIPEAIDAALDRLEDSDAR